MNFIFWFSTLIILYVYLGYPAIIYLISFFYKKPVLRTYPYPMVSVIMSVHNEEKNIENKLKTLLELNYPESRIEILIGSDGSTDRTDEIISKYINERIKLHRQAQRRGKPSMLNLLVKQAKGEILVFTDARQKLERNSIDELVKNFSDTKVGSVSAELIYDGQDSKTGNGVAIYWKYEKFIRKYESKMGSMLGATGALYAIRRELFPELPKDLILDDVYIPLKIVQRGYRAIFDYKAKIYDSVAKNTREEFIRKTRTLAGNFQLFLYLREFFNPFKDKIGWQFFSHKFLRLIAPFLLVSILVSNFFLRNNSYFYLATFVLQILFYVFALFGLIFKHKNHLFDVPYMFCVMNSAAVVGLYKLLTHKQDVLWQKAEEDLIGIG